jgi:hypothetical protein
MCHHGLRDKRGMYRPGLSDLDAVIAVAREGSFRRAALALGMSTTGLSNAVAKLEAKLGVRLFNRTTRSVSLTDAGRAFAEQVGPGPAGDSWRDGRRSLTAGDAIWNVAHQCIRFGRAGNHLAADF